MTRAEVVGRRQMEEANEASRLRNARPPVSKTLMRSCEHGRSRRAWSSALGLAVAACLAGSRIASAQDPDVETWKETLDGGSAAPASSPGLPGGLPAPTKTESATPKPLPTKPPPTPAPTPDPKASTTADKYACTATEALAKDLTDKIEAKPSTGDTTVYPGEAEYRAAYKKAIAEGKDDKAAKEAARKALRDGIVDGTIVDKATGETFADKARREWEGAKRGTPVPPPNTAVPANASQYMKDCAAAGVPLPPPWNDDRWVKKGNLTEVFASGLPTTEVWVSKSPNGICYALPRINAAGDTELLGQICQNEKTGKACFWDNKDPGDGKTDVAVPKKPTKLDPANLAGADKLEENCTECHRGENVFIMHPGTALEQGSNNPCDGGKVPTDLPPGVRYQPIGAPKFQNPEDTALDAKLPSCTACHSIPKLSSLYCKTLLGLPTKSSPPPPPANGMIGKKKMPPGGDQSAPDTVKDIATLKAECAKLP